MAERAGEALGEGLRHWLQERWPAAEDLSLSDFSTPPAGASNETLLFEARWREGGESLRRGLVARMESQAPGVFPAYDLARQYRCLALLGATPVPVPGLAGFEPDPGVLGTPFYLMERVEGRVVTENPPYNLDGWFRELDPAERERLWLAGVGAIASVHRLDWRAQGFDFLASPQLGGTPLAQQLASYEHFLAWVESRGRPYPRLHTALRWLRDEQPRGEEPTALCWGDAKPANLLFGAGEVVAVLDWEMAHLGNPVDDLAWWLVLDGSQSEGLRELLGMEVPPLPGVPGREALIAHWEAASGFSARELPYYECFAAFKFAVIMASIGINMMRAGLMPPESAFDINNTATPLFDRLFAERGLVF